MRVVSWNLLWRFAPNWRTRERGIVETLTRLRPDVVGLQEVWVGRDSSQAELLGRRLGMAHAVATPSLPPVPDPLESPDQEGMDVGVAVLSRWAIAHVRTIRLPATHRYEPAALLATIDHPTGPLHVVVTCVEWEPEFADDQLAQMHALADLVSDPSVDGVLPVLLAADLNAGPDTPQLSILTEVVEDTWVAGGGDPDAVTLSSEVPFAPLGATQQIDRRIDYVLAKPGRESESLRVDRAFIDGRPVDGLYPSDHFAVVVDLTL
jgi:endonuclease/exonuclease/phosphatase family metal-dependent hydrolase